MPLLAVFLEAGAAAGLGGGAVLAEPEALPRPLVALAPAPATVVTETLRHFGQLLS